MKRINFFVIFLLLPIIIFCFSSNAFAASYLNRVFPDFPENWEEKDWYTIIYEPHAERYVLHLSAKSSDGFRYGVISSYDPPGFLFRYLDTYYWYPKSSDHWELYSGPNMHSAYILGEDGKYYDTNGNERILLYSNKDILGKGDYEDFFFPGNAITDFYDHAIDFYRVYLPYYKTGWWDTWDSIGNFWDSISGFLGGALSPLFSVMDNIGEIFAGFLGGLIDIYDAITDFFENFGSKLIDVLKSLFIPEEGFLEDNLSSIKETFNNKFGVAIEMKDSILDAFDQVVSNEFAGIKINFDNSFLPISGEYYIVDPGPVNQYGDRVKPWISGLMILFTVTYILNSIVSIVRGR